MDMKTDLQILFEDAHCLVVAKPPGLLTQGYPGGEASLEDAARSYLSQGDTTKNVYLGTVHRLDRPVSGVVLWAKNVKAARRLSEQFAERVAKKTYWALVETAKPTPPTGSWTDWLSSVNAAGTVNCTTLEVNHTKQAITAYWHMTSASRVPEGSVAMVFEPKTGRTHQLRAQAAKHVGPIVGDVVYGATMPWPHGIALHARRIEVEHPILHTPLIVEAPAPAWWPACS